MKVDSVQESVRAPQGAHFMPLPVDLPSLLFLIISAVIGLMSGFLVAYSKDVRGFRSRSMQVAIALGAVGVLLALVALAGELRFRSPLPETTVWLGIAAVGLGFAVGPVVRARRRRTRL
jgi:hypothetical protein